MTDAASPAASPRKQMIPGARERNTLTYRQPGSMGGPASGASGITQGSSSMDADTIAEREREGGGGPEQRRRP
jgi:hypothetical protein